MKHGSLFSGIGGFDLAAEWMGWENVFHCEINPFCQKVLKHHFRNAASHTDITATDFSVYWGLIDILTGGWPCQRYSVAGKQGGNEPLKEHLVRAIRQIGPRFLVLENVGNFLSPKFAREHASLCLQLESLGY